MLEVLGELDAATRIEVVKRGHAHAARHALESHGAESPQARRRSAAALAAVARAPAANVAAVAAAGGGHRTARTARTRCWHTRTACIRCSPVPGCGIPPRGLRRSGAWRRHGCRGREKTQRDAEMRRQLSHIRDGGRGCGADGGECVDDADTELALASAAPATPLRGRRRSSA